MGTFFSILLDILAILAIIVFGSFIVVLVADLILCMFDNHEGIIFNKKHKSTTTQNIEEKSTTVKKDDIVVYSNQSNQTNTFEQKTNTEKINGEVVTEIDFDKAVEEQQALNRKRNENNQVTNTRTQVKSQPEPKQKEEDEFWDIDEDEDFKDLLDEVIVEAKNSDKKQKELKNKEIEEDNKKKAEAEKERLEAEKKLKEEAEAKAKEEQQKQLDELKALKEEQQKELEEFKQMKEDFAREKEEQLAIYKDNLDKLKAEELDKLKQEIVAEQERLAKEQERLAKEQEELKDKKEELQENKNTDVTTHQREEIVKETIIRDEEEINKLKYKNLVRMNNRLSRIIRDTEKLQSQKQKEIEKQQLLKQKMIAEEQEERLKEQEKRIEIQKQNQERLLKQTEALRRRNEINRKLNEASKKVGKYKLDNAKVIVNKESDETHHIMEETVTTIEETIPGTDIVVKTVEKAPIKASSTPIFEKEYYEQKLNELDDELREAEKDLRVNKSEYIPLTRIHKAYARDSEKLRKKEITVAKQKVALYGVNSRNVDPVKKAKLDENLASLSELKDSVEHCEEVIRKNKDRYPVLEKNNKLLNKQIARINEDIKTCEKAISYYNKKNK